MEEKRRMLVEMPIKVHSYDVDYMQIVNNTVYVKWFEDLRMAMLDQYFPLTEMMKENNTPILAETYVKYQRSVTLESKPMGRVWLSELGASKWVAQFEIVEGDVIYCTGSQVGYYFNLDRHRPVRVPESFVNIYNSL
jgi:acyl-CoA thioester hydrolase